MMYLRKFLIAGSALAAAATPVLIPAAQASNPTGGPVASISVGGSTVTANYPATLVLKSGTSITVDAYGTPTKLTCSAGNAAGTVHAGSPAPSPYLNFSAMSVTCVSWNPNVTLSINLPTNGCGVVSHDPSYTNAHDGTVDTGPKGGKFAVVDGNFGLSTFCPMTWTTAACTITVGGSTGAQFDENIKSSPPDTQSLIIKGSGLVVRSASFLCLGVIAVGDPVTFNNVVFNLVTNGGAGAVDFRKTP
jgi:hypothetical protein